MPSFNRVVWTPYPVSTSATVLIGHLTADPVLSYLPSQTAKADFGIAVNHRFRKQDGSRGEETSFFNCVMFSKRAETFQQYHRRGDAVMIEGRLKQERWEKDGEKKSRVVVVAESFTFIKPNNQSGQNHQPEHGMDGDIPF